MKKNLRRGMSVLLTVLMLLTSLQTFAAEESDIMKDLLNKTSDEGEVEQMSLLPFVEVDAAVVLNGYTAAQIKNVPLQTVLDLLQDLDGNHIEIPDDASIVWGHFKDAEGNVIRDEYHEIAREDTVDLSEFSYTTGYTMEIIAGSGKQLDMKSIRYIVRVYISDKIEEFIDVEFYQQDAEGNRTTFEYDLFPMETTVPVSDVFPGISSSAEITNMTYTVYPKKNYDPNKTTYFGIKSLRDEHPDISLGVFDPMLFNALYSLTGDAELAGNYYNCNALVLNQDMTQNDAGIDLMGGFFDNGVQIRTLYLYYNNDKKNVIDWSTFKFADLLDLINAGEFNSEYDFQSFNIVLMNEGAMPAVATVNTYDESENAVNVEAEHSFYAAYDWDNIDIDEAVTGNAAAIEGKFVITIEYNLLENYRAEDEYYLKLGTENIEKIVIGYFDSLEDAKDEPDIKEQINEGGYKANYGGDGIKMTFFYKNGDSIKYIFKVVQYHNEIPDFDTAPIVGSADPYFRMTQMLQDEKVLDSYIVENGGVYNLDTYYGYGYQTILINDKDADLSSLTPKFRTGDDEVVDVYQDIKQESGVTKKDFSEGTVQYELVWRDDSNKVRNYWVAVVKKTDGPKLFVNGPDKREIFLDDYFEQKHDIFIANVGDEPLTGLKVELNAENVKLDDYWTIGGNSNNTLAPFTETATASDYSELPNVAKIRLLPDGDKTGDIKGTLTVSADGQEPVIIELTGKAGNPKIVTEKISNAVKYVPYSFLVTTNNMHDWNDVSFSLVDGKLPKGVNFLPNGEIYGVPTETGKFEFTVQADYSRKEFESSKTELTLIVDDNIDKNVDAQTDEGYEIKVRIPEKITGKEDQIFEIEYDYNPDEFRGVWLDGKKLVQDLDYTVGPGSTKIVVKSQTLNNAGSGSHTIAAEYRNSNNELKKAAQNYTYNNSEKHTGGNGGVVNYTVQFEVNGGTGIDALIVKSGNTVSSLPTPEREGFAFAGWYKDVNLTKPFDQNEKITSTTTLYAKWIEIYNILFMEEGGESVDDIKAQSGQVVSALPIPVREGFVFDGWYKDETLTQPYDANVPVTGSITLYAKWIENRPPEKALEFRDVNTTDWFYTDVEWVYDRGLMIGINNVDFAPDDFITGGMVVTILARLVNADISGYENSSEEDSWYAPYVKWAETAGITDETFDPKAEISRENAALIIDGFLAYTGAEYELDREVIYFTDGNLVSEKAADALQTLFKLSIFKGVGNNSIDPLSCTTRAQFAALTRRMSAVFPDFAGSVQ